MKSSLQSWQFGDNAVGPILELIYKLCDLAEWDAATLAGIYAGSEHDRRDGFIHFSTAGQLLVTAEKHFAGRDGLVLLAVNASQLGADLKYEPSRDDALFPHLYAPLALSAVVSVTPVPLRPDGTHELPGTNP